MTSTSRLPINATRWSLSALILSRRSSLFCDTMMKIGSINWMKLLTSSITGNSQGVSLGSRPTDSR